MENVHFPENASSVKEEEDTKVQVSETAIIVHNFESQDYLPYEKLKQYEMSTNLDNIKTEFISPEESYSMIDNSIKIEGFNADNIKVEFKNQLLYCEHCHAYYEDYCIKCGMLVHILNKNMLNNTDNKTPKDLPNDILEVQECFGQFGIFVLKVIPEGVKFGPFTGLSRTEGFWKIKAGKFVVDRDESTYLNWMQYVNLARNISERNLIVFRFEENLYYKSTCQIQIGEELLVHFGEEDGGSPNEHFEMVFIPITEHIVKDVFACTICSLGFSSKLYLAKHKTICFEDAAAVNFSIEELTQCQVCKIHLHQREYSDHHLAYCCERNVRKCIPSTPSSQTEETHGPKTCLSQMFKSEQSRTVCTADFKNYTNHNCQVKTCKCRICNKPLKTMESPRQHMENTEHGTSDYVNAYIKVNVKCLLCGFQTTCNDSLRNHMNSKHMKEFRYKCDSCEFRTNKKQYLGTHIKTKHLNQFDFECDSCQFRTNRKNQLEKHIRAKHLNEFDFKCDSCEFRTNSKWNFKVHIKTKHLNEFDYTCDRCEFRTNRKDELERHMKVKHLKEFDYKCDKCYYKTSYKLNLEAHIKVKHLNKFNYECDKCDFKTNRKDVLQKHIKTKHLNKFDYECDKCKYKTNHKNDIKRHMTTKHLKDF